MKARRVPQALPDLIVLEMTEEEARQVHRIIETYEFGSAATLLSISYQNAQTFLCDMSDELRRTIGVTR